MPELYWYRCKYDLSDPAYDGDTLRLWVDLGFNIWIHRQIFRLRDIDAFEIRGLEREKGLVSRDALRQKLSKGKEILIKTNRDKKGKYGRMVADLYIDGLFINGWLVEEGHAEFKKY